MAGTPVKRRTKICWTTLAIFVAGAVILSGAYIASLAMQRWPGNPPPLANKYLTLNMPASPRPAAATRKQISVWVRGLFKGPQAAVPAVERQLIRAGDAVPVLRHALAELTTPRIRHRLRAVLAAIAQADALRGPLITLKLKKATLQTVFTKLCGPAGIVPDFYPMWRSLAPPPAYFTHTFLTLNVQRQPFWQVMRRIALVTGVSPTAEGFAGPELHFGAQPPMAPSVFGTPMPVDINGAFAIAPQWPWPGPKLRLLQRRPAELPVHHAPPHVLLIPHNRRLTILPDTAPARRKLLLLVNVLWCPAGNRLIEFGPLQITQAVDNAGNSLLLPAKPDSPRRANWNGYWSASGQMITFNCRVWLKHPSPRAKVLSVLRGQFPVMLCFGRREYQLKKLSSGKARFHWRGLTVQFRKPVVEPSASSPTGHQRWRVRLVIGFRRASRRQSLLAGDLAQQLKEMSAVEYYTAGGKFLGASQASGYYNANWKGSYDYYITGGKPARARITLYRQTQVKLTVPFELKNIPLPR